ncbi:MAG: ATP-binding protein [Ruthenibacterium lactatiformans]
MEIGRRRPQYLLIGAPGTGKSMLAKRLPGILPPLSARRLWRRRRYILWRACCPAAAACEPPPFRAPHHSVSAAGLVGGGSTPRPGEVSLHTTAPCF